MDDHSRPTLEGPLAGLTNVISYQTERQKKWHAFYSDALFEEICDEIATNPIGMRQLWKKNPNWPARQTFFGWMHGTSERALKLREIYDSARSNQADTLVSENLSIVHGKLKDNHAVNVAKLKCEEHWRQAGKIAPRKYGDRSTVVTKVEEDEDLNNIKAMLHNIKGKK